MHKLDERMVKEDIKSIKGNATWILRLVLSAIVMTLLVVIIKGGI
ncbi:MULTISPECIES: hypothetical protein [Virgibacillus]|nr:MULTISPECIES: hypothetical protein [Virgibacillus]